MESPAMVADALDRVRDNLHRDLKDMTPQELTAGPKPPIGWLVWHLIRVQDANISALAGREQAWIAEGWHARFAMPPEPKDYASGHRQTPAQVDAFTVSDSQVLLDYFDFVLECTKAYLSTLSADDLDRILNEPQYQTPPTVGVRLVSVIADNTRHAGQVEYLRGLIRHQGWFPSPAR
ncbi:MAG: DinB family protein [Acidobacteriota bacterium]